MEDIKTINTFGIYPINKRGGKKLFHSFSVKNLLRKRNLYFLKFEPETKKKYFKSKIKIINNKKQEININYKNNYKLTEYKKINVVNKKSSKNQSKCKININNASMPVYNVKNNNKNVKHNLIKKIEKNNVELFSQNKNISCMTEKPPNMPSLYEHDYNLQNKNIREAYGEINKDIVPNIFYNHLMIDKNNKNFGDNKKKYFKTSVTHRNKKKILTIIYYSPKQQQ